ncbi:MAG: tripartite tricarboxylate transporter TctB family protein [Microbacterium gubbeenense]|uniref:tripartite tricarboxylate transporter TctB family protein n=1 Tax=Microbacterium gubbeenense TaxID=159896 RepID=UPI0003F7E652|nr:tripartite tricarboxylate transporter TctB family protein [Microbacterium gubbeenense]
MSFRDNATALSATMGRRVDLARRALVRDLVMPALLLLFAGYLTYGIVTMDIPPGTTFPGPGFFPAIIAVGLALFAALLIVRALRAERGGSGEAQTDKSQEEDATARRSGVDWRSLAWVVAGFAAFIVLLPLLGWIIAAGLLFWAIARGFGERRHLMSLVVGLTTSSLAYIAFDMLLGMSLPSGILGWGF